MKLSFFAAAILGLAVNGVRISSEDMDFDAPDFAQIDSNTHGNAHGEVESNVEAWTDADCEQMVNGMAVRLQIPECTRTSPDQLILQAVGDLSTKAGELNKALELAFARNQRLAATKTMAISGTLNVTPAIDEPPAFPTPA